MLIVRLNEAFTDTSLGILRRDKLLEGDGGGVTFLADFSKLYSFSGAGGSTAPLDGAAIVDMSDHANGAVRAARAPTFSGNGVDFTPLANLGSMTYLEIPASVLADIWGSANQYYMVCLYVKLPSQADWNSGGGVCPFFGGETPYTSGPDLIALAAASGGGLSFRRQVAAGTMENVTTPTMQVADYGGFAQLAYWRNASGQGGRLRTPAGTRLTTGAVGVNNTQNFSTKKGQAGIGSNFWPNSSAVGTATKWKLYRAFIENLVTSGRDPQTVLDADYNRVAAAGTFS